MSPTNMPDAAPSSLPSYSDPERQSAAVTAAVCVAFALLISLTLYMLGWKTLRKPRRPTTPPSEPPNNAHHQHRVDNPLQLSNLNVQKMPERPKLAKLASGRLDSMAKVAEARTCPVCLDDFTAGTVVGQLLCGHVFCSACIELWLSKHAFTCPMWCVAQLVLRIALQS
ncbi:RING finger protein 43 [Colletotrichum incanum]|nr:RING finger protein 43 [Colletotrichum incanum]